MIQFFKINDPLRIAYLFLVALVIRMIAIIWIVPVLTPELQWMLLGEKLSEGLMLYSVLEDHTAVLSGFFYWLMHELFGRSHVAHMILSSLLIFFQAIIFNLAINKSDLLNEKTYVPGLIYIVVASLYVDFYIVSPVMLSITFMIFTFDRLFQILKHGNSDEMAFRLGANLGIAFLFYKPTLMLAGLIIFDLLLYSNTMLRRYLISIFGFVFPVALIGTFFYWNGSFGGFMEFFFVKAFSIDTLSFLNLSSVLSLSFIPLILTILGAFHLFKSLRYVNIQSKSHYCFFHWLVIGVISMLFVSEFSAFSLIVILPPIAFFITAFFIEYKIKWLSEIYFVAFFGFVLVVCYTFSSTIWSNLQIVDSKNLVVKPNNNSISGKRILALTHDVDVYADNKVATRFLNWRLSSSYFKKIDDYDNISIIYTALKDDLPDIIIDPENHCDKVFKYLPTIGEHYSKVDSLYYRNY